MKFLQAISSHDCAASVKTGILFTKIEWFTTQCKVTNLLCYTILDDWSSKWHSLSWPCSLVWFLLYCFRWHTLQMAQFELTMQSSVLCYTILDDWSCKRQFELTVQSHVFCAAQVWMTDSANNTVWVDHAVMCVLQVHVLHQHGQVSTHRVRSHGWFRKDRAVHQAAGPPPVPDYRQGGRETLLGRRGSEPHWDVRPDRREPLRAGWRADFEPAWPCRVWQLSILAGPRAAAGGEVSQEIRQQAPVGARAHAGSERPHCCAAFLGHHGPPLFQQQRRLLSHLPGGLRQQGALLLSVQFSAEEGWPDLCGPPHLPIRPLHVQERWHHLHSPGVAVWQPVWVWGWVRWNWLPALWPVPVSLPERRVHFGIPALWWEVRVPRRKRWKELLFRCTVHRLRGSGPASVSRRQCSGVLGWEVHPAGQKWQNATECYPLRHRHCRWRGLPHPCHHGHFVLSAQSAAHAADRWWHLDGEEAAEPADKYRATDNAPPHADLTRGQILTIRWTLFGRVICQWPPAILWSKSCDWSFIQQLNRYAVPSGDSQSPTEPCDGTVGVHGGSGALLLLTQCQHRAVGEEAPSAAPVAAPPPPPQPHSPSPHHPLLHRRVWGQWAVPGQAFPLLLQQLFGGVELWLWSVSTPTDTQAVLFGRCELPPFSLNRAELF